MVEIVINTARFFIMIYLIAVVMTSTRTADEFFTYHVDVRIRAIYAYGRIAAILFGLVSVLAITVTRFLSITGTLSFLFVSMDTYYLLTGKMYTKIPFAIKISLLVGILLLSGTNI